MLDGNEIRQQVNRLDAHLRENHSSVSIRIVGSQADDTRLSIEDNITRDYHRRATGDYSMNQGSIGSPIQKLSAPTTPEDGDTTVSHWRQNIETAMQGIPYWIDPDDKAIRPSVWVKGHFDEGPSAPKKPIRKLIKTVWTLLHCMRRYSTVEERIVFEAERQLANLGLTFADLEDKRVLDTCGGIGCIAFAADKLGVNHFVTTLDLNPRGNSKEQHGMAKRIGEQKLMHVTADAREMPFPDGCFDLVLAHEPPYTSFNCDDAYDSIVTKVIPNFETGEVVEVCENKVREIVEPYVNEAIRVLAPDGEFRMAKAETMQFVGKHVDERQFGAYHQPKLWQWFSKWGPEVWAAFTHEKFKLQALELLEQIDPRFTIHAEKPEVVGEWNTNSTYFVLRNGPSRVDTLRAKWQKLWTRSETDFRKIPIKTRTERPGEWIWDSITRDASLEPWQKEAYFFYLESCKTTGAEESATHTTLNWNEIVRNALYQPPFHDEEPQVPTMVSGDSNLLSTEEITRRLEKRRWARALELWSNASAARAADMDEHFNAPNRGSDMLANDETVEMLLADTDIALDGTTDAMVGVDTSADTVVEMLSDEDTVVIGDDISERASDSGEIEVIRTRTIQ